MVNDTSNVYAIHYEFISQIIVYFTFLILHIQLLFFFFDIDTVVGIKLINFFIIINVLLSVNNIITNVLIGSFFDNFVHLWRNSIFTFNSLQIDINFPVVIVLVFINITPIVPIIIILLFVFQ